ncbi:MAG: OmpA family protein [Clostridia bacterium]|nr:OmpA family protein [Clostridia bacterium]
MTARRTKRHASGGDQGAHWISYSDVMASLLIVFVLAVIYNVYQLHLKQADLENTKAQLTIQKQELDEKDAQLIIQAEEMKNQQEKLDQAALVLARREEEVNELNATLKGKEEELALVQIQLQEQEEDLHAAQASLKTQKEEQNLLQLQLAQQEKELQAMQLVVDEQKKELQLQQKRLDDLVGVRTQIIEDLTYSLNRANLKVTVDKTTGDIVLDSAVFFDVNSNTIKDSGKDILNRFLPIYLSVLMRPEYRDYVGEIVIVGHTDTAGSYISNLKLSQNRALSVAEFCLQMPGLSNAQRLMLQDLMTAQGRSYSDPVYNPDGTVNMEASRRVEFKFRLKDEEMIAEMNRILSEFE